jgi:hypothetical protein
MDFENKRITNKHDGDRTMVTRHVLHGCTAKELAAKTNQVAC